MLFKFIVIVLLVKTVTSFFFRRLPVCKNELVNNVDITNVNYSYEARVNDSPERQLKLFLNVSWDVEIPNGLELDGFLLSVKQLVSSHQFLSFQDGEVLRPLENCLNGTDNFWVKPRANETCPQVNTSCVTSPYCPCPRDCSLLFNGGNATCWGLPQMLEGNPHKYTSISKDTRSMLFEATFHQTYVFKIYPYYREFVGNTHAQDQMHMLTPASDCVGLIRNNSDFREIEATQICCDNNIESMIPRNLTVGIPLPDFQRDAVNVSITWLPPVTQTGLDGYLVTVFEQTSELNIIRRPFATTAFPIPFDGDRQQSDCDNITEAFAATLYDLVAGQTYTISIIPHYEDDQKRKFYCWAGYCTAEVVFSVPEINPCDNSWSKCHENATCIAQDGRGILTLNSTCVCNDGYEGIGERNNLSDYLGCMDIDHCNTTESLKCDDSALCVDQPAPLVGVRCQCQDGYSGDGFIAGSGCSRFKHSRLLALKIALPLAVLLIIVIIIVVVIAVRCSKNRKRSFSQLESPQNSIKSDTTGGEDNI